MTVIVVEDLVHRYDGDASPAVDRVSLAIEEGSFVILAGPNGAGKTTLVRHFNALLEPDAGRVRLDGQPVHEHPVAARTGVGMVFQHPRDAFVAATVGADVAFGPENLGLGRAEIDRRVRNALEAVGMAGHREDRVDRLSGGEAARVAIAGALAMEPAYLVMDEPFAGLDGGGRSAVRAALVDLKAGGTGVVVVTHDPGIVYELADRVVVMDEGQIALDTVPSDAVDELEGFGVNPPC